MRARCNTLKYFRDHYNKFIQKRGIDIIEEELRCVARKSRDMVLHKQMRSNPKNVPEVNLSDFVEDPFKLIGYNNKTEVQTLAEKHSKWLPYYGNYCYACSCGSGKTLAGLYFIHARQCKTLIISCRNSVNDQWEALASRLYPELKIRTNGKKLNKKQRFDESESDILIYSPQYMRGKYKTIKFKPSLIIYDEIHSLLGPEFIKVLLFPFMKVVKEEYSELPYMIALSATYPVSDTPEAKLLDLIFGEPYQTKSSITNTPVYIWDYRFHFSENDEVIYDTVYSKSVKRRRRQVNFMKNKLELKPITITTEKNTQSKRNSNSITVISSDEEYDEEDHDEEFEPCFGGFDEEDEECNFENSDLELEEDIKEENKCEIYLNGKLKSVVDVGLLDVSDIRVASDSPRLKRIEKLNASEHTRENELKTILSEHEEKTKSYGPLELKYKSANEFLAIEMSARLVYADQKVCPEYKGIIITKSIQSSAYAAMFYRDFFNCSVLLIRSVTEKSVFLDINRNRNAKYDRTTDVADVIGIGFETNKDYLKYVPKSSIIIGTKNRLKEGFSVENIIWGVCTVYGYSLTSRIQIPGRIRRSSNNEELNSKTRIFYVFSSRLPNNMHVPGIDQKNVIFAEENYIRI